MSNKITRKDAVTILQDFSKSVDDVIMDSGYVVADAFIESRTYIDKGKQVTEYRCAACETIYKDIGPSVGRYYGSRSACPNCGNTNHIGNRYCSSRQSNLFVQEEKDGFKFALYYKDHSFETDADGWQKPVSVYIKIYAVGSFDSENGWYVYDADARKLLGRNSQAEKNILATVRRNKPINEIEGDFDEILAQAASYEVKKQAINDERRAKSKTTLLEEMRSNYRPKRIDEDTLLSSSHGLMCDVYSTKNNVTTMMTYCTKCGKEFETTRSTNDENTVHVNCPDCGTSGDLSYNTYHYSSYKHFTTRVAIFENTNLPENDLLIRVFEINRHFSIDDGYSQEVDERQRIFCGKKVNVYTRPYSYSTKSYGDFSKATVRDVSSSLVGYHQDGQVVQDNEEIAEIIRNSCLMYSGLVESYGFGDKRYKSFEAAPSLKYLMAWYKTPSIELILKSNMTNMVEHMIRNPEHIGSGTTLAEALNVTPAVAKIAAKLNLNYSAMIDLAALYNADNSLTQESFLAISQLNLPTYQLALLKNTYNIDYAQTLKYLESVYNHQCIEKREALTQWVDYLRMATALKIDLADKSRLYPGSLKKEHDVATFAYKAVQIEMDREKFADQAEQNAYFEYAYKDLVVIVPRTPQEIIEEATRQKNCLRSYVESVKEGRTVVAFIRRKIMPDATYVTAEVRNGELTQLKGYCNSNPRNKELVEFVQHWAKAKGIRVRC